MKSFALLALAATARLAAGHATVFNVYVNGVNQGNAENGNAYIRSPINNNPVTDVTSTAMTCNTKNVAVPQTVAVKSGDKVTIEWHHNTRGPEDDIIASSHRGPVLTYLAPTSSNGAGNVWVKIQQDGYDGRQFAVDKLIANRGKYDITVPNIRAGTYLLRSEIIALHEGNRQGGAQFYPSCIQIQVTSAGTVALPAGVAIPGAYKATDPGVLFNLYGSYSSYTIPGPAVWNGASTGGNPAPAPQPAPTTLSTRAATPAPTTAPPSGTVAEYGQCGGQNYSGPTGCQSGLVCRANNQYYSQCVRA